ncbi:MAG: IS4 family transposase [Terriglobia bacterium]
MELLFLARNGASMQSGFKKALSSSISNHIKLSKTRQETLECLVFLVMQHGSICLWRLAAYVSTKAQTESVQRRFYRFFQFVRLDGSVMARVVVEMLSLSGKPLFLAMDRTNWDFGKTAINILMISVIWNGMGIPLIWTLLPTTGNSNTPTRTGLLDRLFEVFPDLQIASLMGDREFIGDGWMAYLKRRKIPFILRLRENQHVTRDGYEPWTIARIAKGLKRGDRQIVKGWCGLGQNANARSPLVRLVIMRLPTGELLALACSGNPRRALEDYRRRWTIETMFGNLKTKGFNMEDTHITDRDKLSTLMAVLALAVAMAVKTGAAAAKLKPVPVKTHGRRALSLFALGLHALRKIFAVASPDQVFLFLKQLLSRKISLKPLKSVVLGRGV